MAATEDPYAAFPHLSFDRPSEGVLRITLDAPGLNAVDADVLGVIREVAQQIPARGKSGRTGDVLRARAPAALLVSPQHLCRERHARANVQRAGAGRAERRGEDLWGI